MSTKRPLTASILSAMLAAGAFAAIGSIMTNPIFAQSDDDIMDDDSSMTSGNATSASSNATKLSGIIASLQNNEAGAPAWITAGYWQLESDRPLFGDDTAEPQVSNFSAVIYMTSITNGSNSHQHEISDFRQMSVLHSGGNVTTVNGTLTISMSDGPHQDTSGYLRLQNDMISIWIDPSELDDHFGPTPVYGIVLPDRFKMDDDDAATAAQGGLGDDDDNGRDDDAAGTTTQGPLSDDDDDSQDDDDVDDRQTGGGTVTGETSDYD